MNYSDGATHDLLLWQSGTKSSKDRINVLKPYSVEGLESKIACPTLALKGQGDGKKLDEIKATILNDSPLDL